MKILILLKEEAKWLYQAEIAKKTNTTYAHVLKVLNWLKEMKLVKFSESGRSKFVCLTETGEEVANGLLELIAFLKLAEIDKEIDLIYDKAIKGKLAEEIDKEEVKSRYLSLKQILTIYFGNSNKKIALYARNLSSRINKVLEETLGHPMISEISHEESQT
ncbi:MAG: winged helix DNA-binding protein [Candidatus Hadarchaeales archaeon]